MCRSKSNVILKIPYTYFVITENSSKKIDGGNICGASFILRQRTLVLEKIVAYEFLEEITSEIVFRFYYFIVCMIWYESDVIFW